jgi:signal transduction histidine kinase
VKYLEPTADRIMHDLKNQLGVVLGFAELFLTDCESDDPRRADIEDMHKAASVALALVNQLPSSAISPSGDEH